MVRSTLAATLVTASLATGGAAMAYAPENPAETSEATVMPTNESGDELAKTGPDNLMLALWAGSAMLVFGAAATGLTVVRRRTNTVNR